MVEPCVVSLHVSTVFGSATSCLYKLWQKASLASISDVIGTVANSVLSWGAAYTMPTGRCLTAPWLSNDHWQVATVDRLSVIPCLVCVPSISARSTCGKIGYGRW